MGSTNPQRTQVSDSISRAIKPDLCDICGTDHDVAQCIGVMESVQTGEGGAATLFFICSRCAAVVIESTTGFRASKWLDSCYEVRKVHWAIKVSRIPVAEGDTDPLD